jgi:hypothetical protein
MNSWIRRIGLCAALSACALALTGCIIVHDHADDDWSRGDDWSDSDR